MTIEPASANQHDRIAGLSAERRALLARVLNKADPKPAGSGEPQLVPDPESRFAPFPLTGLQQAYWIGVQRTDEARQRYRFCLDHDGVPRVVADERRL